MFFNSITQQAVLYKKKKSQESAYPIAPLMSCSYRIKYSVFWFCILQKESMNPTVTTADTPPKKKFGCIRW